MSVPYYSAAWDAVGNTPERSFLICTLPRSGSNILCYSLIENGGAGIPLEYFNETSSSTREFILRTSQGRFKQPGYLQPYENPTLSEYVQHIQHWRTGSNGVWGSKIFLLRLYQYFIDQPIQLSEYFPNLKIIELRRQDKVAQAVSHYIAYTKNSWSSIQQQNAQKLEYSFLEILKVYNTFNLYETKTREFLSKLPENQLLSMTYADFATKYSESMDTVYHFLELKPTTIKPVPIRRQMSRQKVKFCKKFARDLKRNGLI